MCYKCNMSSTGREMSFGRVWACLRLKCRRGKAFRCTPRTDYRAAGCRSNPSREMRLLPIACEAVFLNCGSKQFDRHGHTHYCVESPASLGIDLMWSGRLTLEQRAERTLGMKRPEKKRNIRAIDMFAGGGGSSWGAQQAGVNVVAAFDLWELAEKNHDANFPGVKFYRDRLENLDLKKVRKEVGKVDLIMASPECTNHSPAKGNKPRCEESKDTAFQVTRFAEAFKPKWVVVENVVNMRKWSRYKEFQTKLEGLGYKCTEQILNAADFGVAQSRRRLFLLCQRGQKAPAKTPKPGLPKLNVRPIVNMNGLYKWTPLNQPKRALATLERAARGFEKMGYNSAFLLVYYGSDGGGGWQKLNRPLRTITTVDRFAIVKPSPDGPMMRMLQVPELQQAMGMHGMRFEHGTRRDKIKMIGNAVCPPVMATVLQSLCQTHKQT